MPKYHTFYIFSDFIKDEPKLLFRFFWNDDTKTLKGIVKFTIDSEGPPGVLKNHH